MPSPSKDIIYIDVDDEITGIIDKVRSSEAKIVALVLPKRASILQSIVNMKLLKRSADTAQKRLVLVTTESGLLPLAGAVGLYVAKTPQSKPEIPLAPVTDDSEETIDEEPVDFANEADASRPIGELAGLTAAPALDDDMETLELDNDAMAEPAADIAPPVAAAAAIKVKKNKKLAVPNFERFRLLLILGGLGLVLLIVGLYFALTVLPKATVAVTTNATNLNVGLDLNLNTAAKTLDNQANVVPAKQVQQQKTSSQQITTTGQKNNGQKASGSVTISIKNCSTDAASIPAGTGVSSSGLTYITQSRATLESVKKGGKCVPNDPSSNQDVKVVAVTPGAKFNLESGNFTVAGSSDGSYDPSTLTAQLSDAISGGTDDIQKIVSQADIDAAKQKITAADASGVKQALRQQLEQEGLYAVINTYAAGTPATSNSAEIGTAADTVTVTQVTTYTMYGAKQTDLKALIDAAVKKQIDPAKQSILSEGLDNARFTVANSDATSAQVTMQTTATAGPDISADQIRQQVAGKKGGEIKSTLQANPGVTDVQVKLSPFWVTSVPKKTSKITVDIAKPAAPASR